MKTTVVKTPLPDLVLVTIDYFRDERGFFIEPWNRRDFAAAGLELEFVQEGHSSSRVGVLRTRRFDVESDRLRIRADEIFPEDA